MRDFRPCDACVKQPKNEARSTIRCPGCLLKKNLCRACFDTWIACSEECRVKWREIAANGIPATKLEGPVGVRERKPKGVSVHQKKLL